MSTSDPSKHITFASANLLNFLAPPNEFYDFENIYSQQEWQGKLSWTQQQVEQLNPDIIGLQEVFSIEHARHFFNKIGYPYFASVDTPHVESDYIYSRPVVAIASRFPIERCYPVTIDEHALKAYGDFQAPTFSRLPLCAQIVHPRLGHMAVYVTHLKSQRPAEASQQELASPPIARWLSTQQRGWEAAMLRHTMQVKYASQPMPTVLLGDMNQPISENSVTQVLLTNNHDNLKQELQLYDGWALQTPLPTKDRQATHYHFGTGNVLDYIILSQEFCATDDRSIAQVINYTVSDKHLINPCFAQDRYASDHGFVALTAEINI